MLWHLVNKSIFYKRSGDRCLSYGVDELSEALGTQVAAVLRATEYMCEHLKYNVINPLICKHQVDTAYIGYQEKVLKSQNGQHDIDPIILPVLIGL